MSKLRVLLEEAAQVPVKIIVNDYGDGSSDKLVVLRPGEDDEWALPFDADDLEDGGTYSGLPVEVQDCTK